MDANEAVWYLGGADEQPTGPHSLQHIVEEYRTGRVSATTLCWREGMTDWQPLGQVEPVAEALQALAERLALIRFSCSACGNAIAMSPNAAGRQVKCKNCGAVVTVPGRRTDPGGEAGGSGVRRKGGRRGLRVAVYLAALVAVVGGGGAGAFFMWRGPLALRAARKSVAAARYAEGVDALRTFVARHADSDEGYYLLGLAHVGNFAVGGPANAFVTPEDLAPAKAALQKAFVAKARWREQAQTDIVQIAARVPSRDSLDARRVLLIARLRQELQLADGKELAKELLGRAAALPSASAGKFLDDELVEQIVAWAPGTAGDVFQLLVPKLDANPMDLNMALGMMLRCAREQAQARQALASVLLDRAEKNAAAGRHELAKANLSAADACGTGLGAEIDTRRLALLEKRLAAGDAAGVLQALEHTKVETPELAGRVARLYVEIAKQSCATDPGTAQRALAAALNSDPRVADSEEFGLLGIAVLTQPSEERLRRCGAFLESYPASAKRPQVLLTIVNDAAAMRQRMMSEADVAAARLALAELFRKFPETPELDSGALALAKRLAKEKQVDAAVEIVKELLEVVPSTRRRAEAEQDLAEWQQDQVVPQPEPREAPPAPEPTMVATPEDLTRVMANLSQERVAWIQLSKDRSITDDTIKELRKWVKAGGVLWVDSELASAFDLEVTAASADHVSGVAVVADLARLGGSPARPAGRRTRGAARDAVSVPQRHDVLEGLTGKVVKYDLSPARVVLSRSADNLLAKTFTPFLYLESGKNTYAVVCGERKLGSGLVIFRPRKIDTQDDAGRTFETNLRNYSFRVARQTRAPAASGPDADEE